MLLASPENAFPALTDHELDAIRSISTCQSYEDGQVVFKAGDRNVDFYAVESGQVEIVNPADHNRQIAVHSSRGFAGDIDLLTRRPVLVTAIARGKTVLLRAPANQFRELLNTVPKLSEKLITAFGIRRQIFQEAHVGVKVIGDATCPDTTMIREFLHRNFLPSTWYDTQTEEGQRELARLNRKGDACPLVEARDGRILAKPSLSELSKTLGIQTPCPQQTFDLAIIGAGPAGMTAAVYAASEGLSTVVLDRLGPGGQAGGSSMIENFIGFPSGLSGTELATRGVLQMLKFGATLLSPVSAQSLTDRGDHIEIQTDTHDKLRARAIIIATGARWRKLEARNAARFERAGLYYAATSVEARLCTGRNVAVIGGGNSGGQAAMFLSECASQVHMLIRNDDIDTGMSTYLSQRILKNPRIKIWKNVQVDALLGDNELEALEITHLQSQQREKIDCNAVFVFIGAEPHTQWLAGTISLDDHGYVLTGEQARATGKWPIEREPCSLETTMPKVVAAGDVRCGATKRVAFAVGDAAMAVTCIHRIRSFED